MRFIIPVVIGIAAAGAAYFFKVPLKLGAHPFWADQVILWGAPIGVILGLIAVRLSFRASIIGFVALTGIAYLTAHTGKSRFAASYAEDAFGGQMWFFGWHGVFVFAVAAIVVAATKLTPSQ
jgi:hypothetical protein